ncbi:MAG: hypothetical protein EA379_04210 [Phycisphaerales bacterium]|nr:MAG: hypothetical protein EA379_04210 [Phycisphaerales bacterium]
MPHSLHENDLLAWIEGDLAPERRAEVEQAIHADPVLRARLLEITEDMRALRSLSDVRAPQGLIRDALDAAARESLLLDPAAAPREGVLARLVAPSRFAMAAGLALLVGGGALALWLGVLAPQRGGLDHTLALETAPLDAPTPRADAPQTMMAAADIPGGLAPVAPETTRIAAAPETMHARVTTLDDTAPSRARADAERSVLAALPTIAAGEDEIRRAFGLPGAYASLASLEQFEPVPPMPQGGLLPLLSAVRAIDEANIDWSLHDERFLTLRVAGRDRIMPRRSATPVPVVTPSSYEDALRLASLNRLIIRIETSDTAAVERALRLFATQRGDEVRMGVKADARGVPRYDVEMDRTEAGFGALLTTLQRADADVGAFLDVTLMPAMDQSGSAWAVPPRQISSRGPRVTVPVVIERVGVRE